MGAEDLMVSFLVAENGSGETTFRKGPSEHPGTSLDVHHGKQRKHRNEHTGGPLGLGRPGWPPLQMSYSPWHSRLSFVTSESHVIVTLSRPSFAPGAPWGPANQKAHDVTE